MLLGEQGTPNELTSIRQLQESTPSIVLAAYRWPASIPANPAAAVRICKHEGKATISGT
jgi:hypothetical protein